MISPVTPPGSGIPKPVWTNWEAIGCLVFFPLTTFPFALRCYAKLKLYQRPLIEDWCSFVSWTFVMLDSAVTFRAINLGLTQPAWLLSPEQHETLRKWIYAVTLTYGPAILLTRLTLLTIMARLFSTPTAFALCIRLFIVVVFVYFVVGEIAKAIVCHTVSKFWDPQLRERGYCMNLDTIVVVDTLFAIIVDLAILVIPIVSTVSLRLSLFQKLKVIGLLGAGGVAVGATIYRERLFVEYAHTKNYTQDLVKIIFYCRLEITIGQVCACLPITNCLLQRKAREGAMWRQTKRTRPTAHVWFGSIRAQEHTISSLNSTLIHSYPPKSPAYGCPASGGGVGGERSDKQPFYPDRVVRTARERAREGPRPDYLPPVDEWYHRDVEEGRGRLGAVETPVSLDTLGRPQTPHEVLVMPDRIASRLPSPAVPDGGDIEKAKQGVVFQLHPALDSNTRRTKNHLFTLMTDISDMRR